jgi:beta-lactam-binding protein with PASTA domain/tRNA A-37 threonylcarbamoyl transferase component Bud32
VEDRVFGRRYRITEKIGSGGMADVYKAVDETLGRTVAVKVLHQRYAEDADFVQRFRHEASAAANLSHPAIVNIYDYGVEGGVYYIVMELVRGTDLKRVVQQEGPLDSHDVAEYGAQVCSALSAAHGYGIIHRDIKPQNIVLMPEGTVKVMDFGIARAVDSDATQTGSVLGTAQYVSPEQAQGRKLGPESDLYSLGVVLYELSTGRLPFDGDTPVSVALKHVNDQPVPPRQINPQIPPALEAVILKAMEKDPHDRYHSAEEMREDLLRVVAGRAVSAQARVDDTTVMPIIAGAAPAAAAARAVPTRRGTNPWVWIAIVVLLLALGLGGAWAYNYVTVNDSRVPDVTGQVVSDARQALTDSGYLVGTVTDQPSETVAKDLVISTDPTADATLPKGRAVDLTVSSGPPMVTMPSVMGLPEQSAITTLQAAGFAVDPLITRAFNKKFKAGTVFAQDPLPDTHVVKGAKVHLSVSEGVQMVAVPDVVNQSKSDAIAALKDAGFTVSTVSQPNPSVATGTVFDQKPSGGGQAAKGSNVTIYISTGPKQVAVPNLHGLTQAQATAKLASVGLNANVQQLLDADPTHTGLVENQDPPAGTKVDLNATVTIYVASITGP